MNSGTVLAGTDGFTSITRGPRMSPPTGAIANEIETEPFIKRISGGPFDREAAQKRLVEIWMSLSKDAERQRV
jgi:hypothetical protein